MIPSTSVKRTFKGGTIGPNYRPALDASFAFSFHPGRHWRGASEAERSASQHDSQLQIRTHGPDSLRTLVYLPGLHGDWTLIGRFRKALAGRVRFVEITYPRTLTWSLEDYATGVEIELARHGITGGWFLAESFSSQVLWPLLLRKRFLAEGVIL